MLERIRQRFADRKFVTEIVTIPDYYLRNNRGFGGLQGVQRLYSVDVMALVSYDQITHMDENEWSFGYLTIVGAYVLKGSHHDVATLVDLAVVDPVTQSLILRAGGTDSRNRNTTLIDEEREARESGAASFGSATTQMIDNFDAALTKFEADVRAGKANIRVAKRESQWSCRWRRELRTAGARDAADRARRAPSAQACRGFPWGQSHILLSRGGR